jgi:hypothetical protein
MSSTIAPRIPFDGKHRLDVVDDPSLVLLRHFLKARTALLAAFAAYDVPVPHALAPLAHGPILSR